MTKLQDKLVLNEVISKKHFEERQTYTVLQIQSILGISRSLAYQLINDGSIPSLKLGKTIRIPKSYIDSILCNQINHNN